jgi:hypothetical protein
MFFTVNRLFPCVYDASRAFIEPHQSVVADEIQSQRERIAKRRYVCVRVDSAHASSLSM